MRINERQTPLATVRRERLKTGRGAAMFKLSGNASLRAALHLSLPRHQVAKALEKMRGGTLSVKDMREH